MDSTLLDDDVSLELLDSEEQKLSPMTAQQKESRAIYAGFKDVNNYNRVKDEFEVVGESVTLQELEVDAALSDNKAA